MKIRLAMDCGYAGTDYEEEMEVDDDTTEEELEEMAVEFFWENFKLLRNLSKQISGSIMTSFILKILKIQHFITTHTKKQSCRELANILIIILNALIIITTISCNKVFSCRKLCHKLLIIRITLKFGISFCNNRNQTYYHHYSDELR